MTSDLKSVGKIIKKFKKILINTSGILKDTSDQVFKLSESLNMIENKINKMVTSEIRKDNSELTKEVKITKEQTEERTPPSIKEPKKIMTQLEVPPKKDQLRPPIAPKKEKVRSQTKLNLDSIRDGVSDLLDRLKNTVSPGIQQESVTIDQNTPQEDTSWDSFKGKISDLYKRFKGIMEKEEFYEMTPNQREKALTDMAEAINILTDEYNKCFKPKEE